MAKLHRFTTPAYYTGGGTFPVEPGVTFDYINVVSGGIGAGGSAFADGAKGAGPNAGTYFMAFGEDATSSNFNRPQRALAENCDYLDDALHRSIATPAIASGIAALSTQVVLPVGTYLGPGGLTNDVAGLRALFSLLNANADEEITTNPGGVAVVVDHMTGNAGDLAKITGAGGYADNAITAVFTAAVPAGITARLWYGARSNLATLPSDAFTSIKIRSAQEVSAAVENVLRNLHGNSLDWNAAWTMTIFELATGGFDSFYRHRTTPGFQSVPPASNLPANTAVDTPGAGSWYIRDGVAMAGYSRMGIQGAAFGDPLNALWKTYFQDTASSATGFAAYGRRRFTNVANETTTRPGLATYLSLVQHNQTGSQVSFYTNVPAGSTCTVALVSGEGNVVLTQAGAYWSDGAESAIAVGYDMVEITWTESAVTKPRTYVISGYIDTTTIRVRNPDGTVPVFPVGPAAGTVTWIKTSWAIGDGGPQALGSGVALGSGGFFSSLPKLRGTEEVGHGTWSMWAPRMSGEIGALPAFQWGGYSSIVSESVLSYVPNGFAYGDGSLATDGGNFRAAQHQWSLQDLFVDDTAAPIDVLWRYGWYRILVDYTGGTTTATFNFTDEPKAGSMYFLDVTRELDSTVTRLAITSPGVTNVLSVNDSYLQPIATDAPAVRDHYIGYAVSTTRVEWTVLRF